MGVQYDDGSLSELMDFPDALAEFLKNPRSKALHKFKNESEYQEYKTKADLQAELEKAKVRLDELERELSPVKSSILHIPTDAEKDFIEKHGASAAINPLTGKIRL